MAHLSTHVLDTSQGRPAAGILVVLQRLNGDEWRELARQRTDADGRAGNMLAPDQSLQPGDYRLIFDTALYFLEQGGGVFYPEVVVRVRLDGSVDRFHLPLLLNPFGYSTYRGS